LKALCLAPETEGLLKPSLWNGREALQAQNYAGLLITPSGLSLEVYPKIFSTDTEDSRKRELALLMKMLRAVPELPF
jgi:hypothetical protein